ncbi:hypothetical protein [Mucilaginibacter ginsenosidivorax]|uniref:Uncharacterized protein n=1 Tax=Mucilaginibacter ginsenosidivorax TaxID=862126 RepID=A0A5B8W4H5_9SPHI|nr:hypothetical protein [Mucilaginibacter ginsenosidivorax]QEC78744.1 hypothetical protein FSB76_23370 [Mucilaginibacter ginsenosidivorax]
MQSNFKNDITQPVIFNTPKSLDLSGLFPAYSEDKLNKVRYIIHQCNYYSNKSGYNLDLNNHRWFLSLTRNDLSFIKKTLVEASVIKLSSKSIRGAKSEHYSMVKTFNYLNEATVNKHFFYLNTVDCPLWVQRYVADDSACRNAETTNWVKRPNDWQPSTVQPTAVQPLEVQNNDKDAYIKLLEAALIANNIALPAMDSIPAIVQVSAPEALKPEAAPAAQVLQPEPKPVDKAKQFLAGLKAQTAVKSEIVKAEPVKPEPSKALTALNTDVQPMEGFLMVNSTKYKRATQLMPFMKLFAMERRLQQLVAEGYQGNETFTTETWILTFEIDASTRTVTLSGVLDAELAA